MHRVGYISFVILNFLCKPNVCKATWDIGQRHKHKQTGKKSRTYHAIEPVE